MPRVGREHDVNYISASTVNDYQEIVVVKTIVSVLRIVKMLHLGRKWLLLFLGCNVYGWKTNPK